ncbi:MAG: sn-glycerol-1-phosphate dehydrogenase [Ruminococcaceae bacterium]|nr:sn-glycerol-1-phosphate dehydrogenase [Oscillospiraceae bacterium]
MNNREFLGKIEKNNTPCPICGRAHTVFPDNIVMNAGALEELPSVIAELGDFKKIVMVCDYNTYEVAGKRAEDICNFSTVIRLNPVGLHPTEKAVATVDTGLDADLLVAVGSGTIHDITRYVAFTRGINFVSVPTAASVDGYVSNVAVMTWCGTKKTLPAVPPIAMVADTNIIAKAPYELTASGIGDMIGKYTALFDWRYANMITGEYICDRIIDMEEAALKEVVDNLEAIKAQDVAAIEALMYALVLSGLAMQMVGNSRPASGAEHHISHFIEMGVMVKDNEAYHGEKVGVATALVVERYFDVLSKSLSENDFLKAPESNESVLKARFGELADELIKENTPDPLLKVDKKVLLEKWSDIQKLANDTLPTAKKVREYLASSGCSVTLSDIKVDEAIKYDLVNLSPLVRNRLTFMRTIRLLNR